MSQCIENWQTKALSDVAKIQSGSGFPLKYQGTVGEQYPFYKVSDMNLSGNEVNMCNVMNTVSEETRTNLKAKVFPPGSIIFPKVGGAIGTNKKRLTTQDCCVDNNVMGLIPKQEIVVSKYLFYFMSSFDLLELSNKANPPSIRQSTVKAWSIPLPPLPEQKRIVAILDEVFAGITKAVANAEKNLTNARELFSSYLENLSYEKQPLGDFVYIRTGKLNANAAVEGGQYPFFTCSREVYEIDNYAFDCEAILLAGNNASGDFNVKHFNGRFNAYQRTYIISIMTDAQLLYRFLYFQLIKSLKELKKSSVGVGTKFLKLGMIKNLMISVPTVKKQRTILKTLDQLLSTTEHLESIYQQKLTALAELKQSILQKAFTGELTADTSPQEVSA